MPIHVAFLRAINLGSVRKFPKDDIVAAAVAAGFTDVATHINTGNVRVSGPLRSRTEVETALERAFEADRGFPVPTIAFATEELMQVLADADELAAEMPTLGSQYVSLLKDEPSDDVRRLAEAGSTDHARLVVRGRAAHLLLDDTETFGTTRLSNTYVEKKLGTATNRNVRVLRAIAEKWCSWNSRAGG